MTFSRTSPLILACAGGAPSKVRNTTASLTPGARGAARDAESSSVPPGAIFLPAIGLIAVHLQLGMAASTVISRLELLMMTNLAG